MDFSLATLRYAFVWNVTQRIQIHAACGYSKTVLTMTKGIRSSSSRSKVDISWLRPLASCLSSCWLSQLPSCPSSLRCCSCPCHCPCPQLLAAHPAWDAVLKLRTVLSPAFHLPSASQASSTSPLYCHTVKTQASKLRCHTLTFTFSLFLPLLLNFIILIPASSASEAPWVKWPDFVAQNDDLGREQVNLLNLRSKVHSDKQIHLSFNNVSPPLAGLIGSRSWY